MDKEDIAKRYTDVAAEYESLALNDHYVSFKRAADMVVSHTSGKNVRVLDVGCGTGLSSRTFLDNGWAVSGFDISAGMIAKAQELPFKRLHVQDVEDRWDYNDGSFDVVTCIGLTEFVTRTDFLLSESQRVLDDGGLLAITFPKCSPGATALDIQCHDKQALMELFKAARATIIDSQLYKAYHKNGEEIEHYLFLATWTSAA